MTLLFEDPFCYFVESIRALLVNLIEIKWPTLYVDSSRCSKFVRTSSMDFQTEDFPRAEGSPDDWNSGLWGVPRGLRAV